MQILPAPPPRGLSSIYRLLFTLMLALTVVLSACGSTSTTTRIYPTPNLTPPAGLSGTALTNWQVEQTQRPIRDLNLLVQQLKHVTNIATGPRTTPLNRKVGDVDQFWIQAADNLYQKISAKVVYMTAHAYHYVQEGTTVDIKALKTSADLFENSFAVTDRRYFGSEQQPGIDGDPHITILNASTIVSGENGYFSSADEYTAAVAPYSNEREIFYLHVGDAALTPNTDAYNQTMAHEFQHLIHWRNHPKDPSWVNEGMSVMAQHINGLDAGGFDAALMANTNTQLNSWSSDASVVNHYGAGYLFIDYFAEHYGGYGILKELLSDPNQIPQNFNDVLQAHGYSERFNDVFAKWVMTNALNDEPQGSNQTYMYKTIAHLHATLQNGITALPYTHTDTTHQYAAQYYDLRANAGAGATLNLGFTGKPTVPLLTAPPASGDGTIWWSNRGDNMDSTLTRSFDLTSLKNQAVELNFTMWYDLEPLYDYGYVEVSDNGGKTWNTIAIDGSQTADPNGANLGQGVTATNSDTNSWTPVTVDLTPYAGTAILVRFETVTDDALNGQGMAIANIAIPAIHFVDAPQTANGWDQRGWMRVTPTLAETYIVQVALFNADGVVDSVLPMTVAAAGTGQLSIPGVGAQVSRVVIAVSAVAPATTVDTTYTLTVTGG